MVDIREAGSLNIVPKGGWSLDSHERLHWPDGERDGWTGAERVALSGVSSVFGSILWWELTNVHESPARHFAVDGEEVAEVLRAMKLAGVHPSALWHSHESNPVPSEHDIAELPHWVATGVVWCARSGELSAYDRDASIFSTTVQPARVTSGS